jgi:DNA-binding MarR family transcriptional regulator
LKKEHNASIVKKLVSVDMVYAVQEFLEPLHWKLNAVLDREGISMLQWAFMYRALDKPDGIEFGEIMKVTGESKDNVRRAAAALEGFADVVVDPKDRRARKLVMTKRGKRRTRLVFMRFEQELLKMLGARETISQRAEEFKRVLWDASAFLDPSYMAHREAILRSQQNRQLIPDDSLKYVQDDSESKWTKEPPEDGMLW